MPGSVKQETVNTWCMVVFFFHHHGDLFLAAYDVPALVSVNFYPDYLKDAWEIVVRSKKPAKTEPHSSARKKTSRIMYVVKPNSN